jgi:hypothetical protein
MMRKHTLLALLLTGILAMLVTSGCYTKFYRPGMEMNGSFSSDQLYERYDSSAIDTTLTRQDWYPDYYPYNSDYSGNNYGWNDWGRPRGYTRWGFDFYNFSPGYYHSYYGYYDYYGSPWWNRSYNRRPWYYGGGGSAGPSEPPSQRDGRRQREGSRGPGGAYSPPGTPSSGGVYQAPRNPQAPPPKAVKNPAPAKKPEGNSQKRTGKRRR